MAPREPVRRPLPDVAGHPVQAVPVRGERTDRRGALEAIEAEVLPRELALPGVGPVPTLRRQFVPPRVDGALEATARRVLPLGLRRQLLARPRRVRRRVVI